MINGKSYIGQTTNSLKYRQQQHIREMKSIKRKNTYFHNALNYYGIENFRFEIIDTAENINDLNNKESFWIKFYNSTNKEYGYNLDSGGTNCFKSQSTKNKIGKKKRENWKDETLKHQMKNGLEKATKKWQEVCPRETRTISCINCNKPFKVSLWESKKRKFCSQECANTYNIKKATEKAKITNHDKCIKRHLGIKRYVLNWAKQNTEIIINCKMNRIDMCMKTLIEDIYKNFEVKDLRTISNAVIGNSSKRKFIKYLKSYII